MPKMKTILITGSNGYIGKQICENLSRNYRTICVNGSSNIDSTKANLISVCGDITDAKFVEKILWKYRPDVLLHCAAIANESIFHSIQSNQYEKVNSHATEQLCRYAVKSNPELHFIFLSSITVYGENHSNEIIKETDELHPTSDYAKSKLSAENRLKDLYKKKMTKKIDILRLPPVYDSYNLSTIRKRIMAPKLPLFLIYGSGKQRMSLLSIQNLIGFIQFRIENAPVENNLSIFNLTDRKNYSFHELIDILRKNGRYSNIRTIKIPLIFVWMLTRILGFLFFKKTAWIHSWYDKLSSDFIFDNQNMVSIGFSPKYEFEKEINLKTNF